MHHFLPHFNPSVPKLSFLRATEQINDSILIEWELEYNGGFPIVSFELQVILQTARAKRDTPTNPDLIYHTDVDNGHLVTRSVENGRSYVVMAIVYNTIGSSDEFAYGKCIWSCYIRTYQLNVAVSY